MKHDLVIIGGGPAGLAAAIGARENGIKDIVILERSERLGGILNQCIHNGFGLQTFKKELTGPEYAQNFIDTVLAYGICFKLNTMVIDVKPHKVTYVNDSEGVVELDAGAIILAMGCRERPRGALNIPGTRPSGIFSAGTAQRLINMEGLKLGSKVVILGSGDIGLIMARRLTLQGAKVSAVVEVMPYSSGLKRNIVQCLDDYSIPLLLSHTITRIEGQKHLERVIVSEVDSSRKPIRGTEKVFEADTLLLSVGLLPENELSRGAGVKMSTVTGGPVVGQNLETNQDGIFACGNVLHVHDLVDFVSEESHKAGSEAARYLLSHKNLSPSIEVQTFGTARYCVPQMVNAKLEDDVLLRFRVKDVTKGGRIVLIVNDVEVASIPRKIMTPGEMESIVLKKSMVESLGQIRSIRLGTEERP